jgi:hypothetical protein
MSTKAEQEVGSMQRKTLKALAVGLAAAAFAAAPAPAALDEGGGAAHSVAPPLQAERFDWGDAGVGIGIGVAAGIGAAGTALVVRRRRLSPHGAARPAAR